MDRRESEREREFRRAIFYDLARNSRPPPVRCENSENRTRSASLWRQTCEVIVRTAMMTKAG